MRVFTSVATCVVGLFALTWSTGADVSNALADQNGFTSQHVFSSLTEHSPFAYQWARMYEDPSLVDAWNVVDSDLKAEIEALLFTNRVDVADGSSTVSSPSSSSQATQSASTLSTQASGNSASSTSSSQGISSTSAPMSEEERKKEEQKKQQERIDELEKRIKDLEKQKNNGTSFQDEAGRQDCGFGPLNSTTWKESGASATLKEELELWRKKQDGKSFHAHMFETYALGLARSSGHCNGRGFCSPVSCQYVDAKLPADKRKKAYFIMEAIARLSRATNEENDVLKDTLALLSSQTINIVRDYTPMIQHDRVRDAKAAWDAEEAKKADMISLIVGGLIPMFCCFVPGGAVAESMGKFVGQYVKKGAELTKEAAEKLGGRMAGIVGNSIGSTVALTSGAAAHQMRRKDAETAGKSPIQEVVVTLADYQTQMSAQIERFQDTMLDRAEMLLNGSTFDGNHDLFTETETGIFLDVDIDDRQWLNEIKTHVQMRTQSSMINHAWRSNHVFIVMSDVRNGTCEADHCGAKELKICLPEVPDKVFYIFRYDDAFNNRRKDVITSPNGWSKLPKKLNITLENITRASYAWFTTFEYQDYNNVNITQMLGLQEKGGPLHGAVNIPITYSPDGASISEVGDPVKMVGKWKKPEDLDNRGPCISGTSWRRRIERNDNSYGFIAATGLYVHPSFHERCNKNAHCDRDMRRGSTMYFYEDTNMRFSLPWSREQCAAKGGQNMVENKHHWCDTKTTRKNVVKMRRFKKCEPAPRGYKITYSGHVPE